MEERMEKNWNKKDIKGQHVTLSPCFNIGTFFQCLGTCFPASHGISVHQNTMSIHAKVYAKPLLLDPCKCYQSNAPCALQSQRLTFCLNCLLRCSGQLPFVRGAFCLVVAFSLTWRRISWYVFTGGYTDAQLPRRAAVFSISVSFVTFSIMIRCVNVMHTHQEEQKGIKTPPLNELGSWLFGFFFCF